MMINNYTNISKKSIPLSLKVIEHTKDQDICRWKVSLFIWTGAHLWQSWTDLCIPKFTHPDDLIANDNKQTIKIPQRY